MKLLILAGTIVVILSLRYNFFANEFSESSAETDLVTIFFSNYFSLEFLKSFFDYAEHYATFINIVSIPVFALISYLVFGTKKYNFAENLILNTYITAFQLLLTVFLVPFLELSSDLSIILIPSYTIISVFYNIWAYIQFFDLKLYVSLPKSILVVILSYTLQFLLNILVFSAIKPILSYIPSH